MTAGNTLTGLPKADYRIVAQAHSKPFVVAIGVRKSRQESCVTLSVLPDSTAA